MSIEEKQNQIISEFNKLGSWEDRYKKLIQLGKDLPEFPDQYHKEDYLVKGCQSQVWLYAFNENGKMHIIGDSDAMIVKGLLAIVLKVYNDQAYEEIMKAEPRFVTELGLNVHLSQSRSNGLASMIKQIKLYAMAFYSMAQQEKN
ncbi:MAG: SufE family protein [Bdellovibrionales bacterium]